MERSALTPDQAYYDQSAKMFFITPDCFGGYWYDTLAELEDQHGQGNNPRVIHVTEIFD